MKHLIKQLYHNTVLGDILRNSYHGIVNNVLPVKWQVKYRYKKVFKKYPNIKNPQTLNEKIIWLKLFNKDPLQTVCADKYEVRAYIEQKIGKKYLVPLYFSADSVDDIIPKNLPDDPFIIKTNHDSGGGIIVRSKADVNWDEVQESLAVRLKKNYYKTSKEWQYKNIKPKILVEKLLQDVNGNIPFDYKLHCFNGKVQMVQVDLGRGTKNHYRNWYSSDWKRQPYKWSSPKGQGVYTDPSETDVTKPETLPKMIALSEILSEEFDYVRVDWYDVDGALFFGEMTFHHDGGYQKIIPENYDLILGQMLNIKELDKG